MKILITGSNGMLGRALCSVFAKDGSYNVTGLDLSRKPSPDIKDDFYETCDITDTARLFKIVKQREPDLIIHAAAFTDVDECESNPDKAETVNGLGARCVAEAAVEINAGLIYISTDFVFDGEKRSPYTEDDTPNPLGVYGSSKLNGEKSVEEIMENKRFFIIRTSWLFGEGGKNFIDAILKKAKEEKKLRVVTDQFGSPTYTLDLAGAIMRMLSVYGKKDDIYGTYHITNSDDCSWYRLAQKALELARLYEVDLIPIVSEELDRPAVRPAMSILDNRRYIKLFGEPLRRWDKALEEYIRLMRRR
ncbi:dTDP-4-dehydrorhamnose reductase [Omnitrophica bacterium]|nr:dTDP-4-dehydrorhamnose reductase [Candidatus Omnitrophota bacterium]